MIVIYGLYVWFEDASGNRSVVSEDTFYYANGTDLPHYPVPVVSNTCQTEEHEHA